MPSNELSGTGFTVVIDHANYRPCYPNEPLHSCHSAVKLVINVEHCCIDGLLMVKQDVSEIPAGAIMCLLWTY